MTLPLALPAASKDRSIPFPCMYSSCSCQDAETCWLSCGCTSHVEKLAFAKAHSIAVPDYYWDNVDWEDRSKGNAKKPSGCCSASKPSTSPASCCGSVVFHHEQCQVTSEQGCCGSAEKLDGAKQDRVAILTDGSCRKSKPLIMLVDWTTTVPHRRSFEIPDSQSPYILETVGRVAYELEPPVPPPKIVSDFV